MATIALTVQHTRRGDASTMFRLKCLSALLGLAILMVCVPGAYGMQTASESICVIKTVEGALKNTSAAQDPTSPQGHLDPDITIPPKSKEVGGAFIMGAYNGNGDNNKLKIFLGSFEEKYNNFDPCSHFGKGQIYVIAVHEITHSVCPNFEKITAFRGAVDPPPEGNPDYDPCALDLKVLTEAEYQKFQACEEIAADANAVAESCNVLSELLNCLNAITNDLGAGGAGDPMSIPGCEEFIGKHPELKFSDGSPPSEEDLKDFGGGICAMVKDLVKDYASDEKKQEAADCACNTAPKLPGSDDGYNDYAEGQCQVPLPPGGCDEDVDEYPDSYPFAVCDDCSNPKFQ